MNNLKNQVYKKNIRIYYIFNFFINMMIIGPVLVPYMLFKGLSYTQIMQLQAISAIAVFFFEVPTGAIADKISRKFSLCLSGLFMASGLLIYIKFSSFFPFVFAEILFGIGLTFYSGADSALLYESLTYLNRQKEYQKIEGNALSAVFTGQAIGSILSSILYKSNPFLPFWISLVNLVIASIIAFFFKNISFEKSKHNYAIHIIKSAAVAIKTPRIFWTICLSAIMGILLRNSFWLYQPLFKEVDIDVFYFGFIFFFLNIVAAFSSRFLVKKFAHHRQRRILITFVFIMGLSFILPVIIRFKLAIVFLAFQQIVRGMYQPTLKFYINHQIQDKYRATVISLVSLVANLSFFFVAFFFSGYSLDHYGTYVTYLVFALFAMISVVFLIVLRKVQKKIKNNILLNSNDTK